MILRGKMTHDRWTNLSFLFSLSCTRSLWKQPQGITTGSREPSFGYRNKLGYWEAPTGDQTKQAGVVIAQSKPCHFSMQKFRDSIL